MKINFYILKRIFSLKKILLVLLLINFNIFFWQVFESQSDSAFTSLDFVLTITGFIVGTQLYITYYDDFFLKISKLKLKSKTTIKITIFIGYVLFMFFTFFLFMAFIRLYSFLGWYSKTDFYGGKETPIRWELFDRNNWVALFYYVTLEILLIVFYVYMLNHFFKNSNIVYGIMTVVFLYVVFFGTMFLRVGTVYDSGERFLTIKPDKMGVGVFISFIIAPWQQVAIIANRLFFETAIDPSISDPLSLTVTNWFDYSHMGSYSFLLWTPYLSLFVMLFLTTIF